ncbi:serine transporter [Klebsiella pneumoniae]|uniref:Serine transporter n=1 Tax=Klebsiella pneumoniae TaxID=573 RepID=A0A377TQ80_KLEPN|nr:serine transporter [Klebsiella pneumoniae]
MPEFGGFWPLLIVFVLAFPITYLAHRGLARFIYSSNTPESSITDVIGEHFGALAGKVFTVIYFFAVYTILIMYAVAITNTAQSFITHQLAMAEPPRSLVAIVLILGLMFIVRFGQRLIMRVMSTLVYPFIISLIFMALFLIPHWNGAILQTVSFSATGDGQGIMLSLWMTFPVLVMSFNHYPIISPMVVRQKQRYGLALAEGKCAQIQRYGILLMTVVVLVFCSQLRVKPVAAATGGSQARICRFCPIWPISTIHRLLPGYRRLSPLSLLLIISWPLHRRL